MCSLIQFWDLHNSKLCNTLTKASPTGEEALVEVFIVDAHGFDKCWIHAHNSFAHTSPANKHKSIQLQLPLIDDDLT